MDPKVALIMTIVGIVVLVGIISALAVRFIKANKILKEHGETLFKKKDTKSNAPLETATLETQREAVIQEAKAKGYTIIPAGEGKTLEDLKKEGVKIITLGDDKHNG